MVQKTLKYIIIIILLLLVVFIFYGLEEEERDPLIEGVIYEITDTSFLVAEGLKADSFESVNDLDGRAVRFDLIDELEVIDQEGQSIDFENLSTGNKVKVWHTGFVRETYPEQANAMRIQIVDPEGELKFPEEESYESDLLGISLEIPKEAEINYEEGQLKVTFVGPDSHMTEITDGFTLFVDLYDDDLEAVTEDIFSRETEILDAISDPEETELSEFEGYEFVVEGGLGNEINYFIYQFENKVIALSYSIIDPNDVGYIKKVERIVSSIEVKDGLQVADECVVSGCSGELCELESMESTCEHLPGAECLEYAGCQFIDDECGWVLTEESAECFIEIEEEFGPEVRDSRIGYLFEEAEEILN